MGRQFRYCAVHMLQLSYSVMWPDMAQKVHTAQHSHPVDRTALVRSQRGSVKRRKPTRDPVRADTYQPRRSFHVT